MNEEELEEKTFNEYVCILNKSKQLEKELKQTKLNFKNSQTHSKNCYKKLKEKYEKLERAYKNNEVLVRDLNELINRNLELKDELKRSQETISAWMENHKKLIIDNGKLKQAIKILEDKIEFEDLGEMQSGNMYRGYFNDCLDEEEVNSLKEVFERVGEE